MELGHLDKHSLTTQERKAPQGKNLQFFCLETLKSGHFFLKLGQFFPIFKKGRGDPPCPPSSYAPAALGRCLEFTWFFANFSLALLIKVLLLKRQVASELPNDF